MNGLSIEEIKKHYTEESFALKTKNAQLVNRTKHIGDEIIKCGEPWIIVSTDYSIAYNDRRYPKRRYVWEQAYGEIPKDHCIICLDGNKMNCNLDNLYCLPNKYKSIMARNKWFFKDKEMTLTAIKWCELHYALKECT